MLLTIHLFFLVCCTPFYLAIKEMPVRAFVMYTDASRHKQQIQYLALFNNASTVINRVLHVINHLFYDIISTPQALTYRFSARSGWLTFGVLPNTYNSTTFVTEGKRERKKRVCCTLSYSMDVFPVGRPLFFQNSKEPLQNQQQQQTPVYSHSLPSPIVNSARELDRVLSRLEMLR